MINKNIFMQMGNTYHMTEENFTVHPTLTQGIYNMLRKPDTDELYLERIGDKFEFNFKLYGVDDTLVKHVLRTYENAEAKHNIGVLLNGTKGTGRFKRGFRLS